MLLRSFSSLIMRSIFGNLSGMLDLWNEDEIGRFGNNVGKILQPERATG